jgi:hypothetical protein
MKPLLPILLWLLPCLAMAQAKEVPSVPRNDTIKTNYKSTIIKPEILTSGIIDIINNGKVNASARSKRLMIKEPDNFICMPEKNV